MTFIIFIITIRRFIGTKTYLQRIIYKKEKLKENKKEIEVNDK